MRNNQKNGNDTTQLRGEDVINMTTLNLGDIKQDKNEGVFGSIII